MAQKLVRYARLVTQGELFARATYYEGPAIGQLTPRDEYDPNFKMTETEALNLLGAEGFEIYGQEKVMDGQIHSTVFRLRAVSEE